MGASGDQVTALLRAAQEGDEKAGERLVPLVYTELHRLAAAFMRRERPDHTLQPTALINEAFLRLTNDAVDWQNRAHFIGVAANVMRRVLVDHARKRDAAMRGGDRKKVELDEQHAFTPDSPADVLALDRALDKLAKTNPRQAKVVELRFFGGLEVEEAAKLLDIAPRSVKRDWALAKIFLHREIYGSGH